MTMFRLNGVPANIRALPILQSASGSIATFDTDMTENLVEVLCQIVAQQASGTPTPDNPLPITVYDDLTLYHNSINLWNEVWEVGSIDGTTGKNITGNNIRTKGYIKVTPDTAYCFVMSSIGYLRYYDSGKNYIGEANIYNPYYVRTVPNNCYYVRFVISGSYGITYNNDISINYPSTDTQYHAFNGAYIPFGQTVANGVLDVTTGKLRLLHKVVELDENWYWFKGGTQPSDKTVISTTNFPSHVSDDEFSSHFAKATTAYIVQMAYGDFMLSATGTTGYFCYKNSDDGTVEEFKQYIVTQRNNGTPIQVYYKLDTPIEIQLDSITLQALLNENNIWCDTGDTSVKYWMSINKYIGQ